ncbi:MAG TPA: hypothetical protein V6D47_19200 [Oscillatoriaceae cyanobacterium]
MEGRFAVGWELGLGSATSISSHATIHLRKNVIIASERPKIQFGGPAISKRLGEVFFRAEQNARGPRVCGDFGHDDARFVGVEISGLPVYHCSTKLDRFGGSALERVRQRCREASAQNLRRNFMALTEAQMIARLNAAVVRKSIEDAGFRAQLLKDPKGTIEKALNLPLPSGFTLKVAEAPQNEFTVVLPYQVKTAADGEMSDSDLESVAGGSKSGATSFFNGLADGMTGSGGGDGSTEGTAGAITGAVGIGILGAL